MKHRVMHAMLRIGEAVVMLSDGPGDAPAESGKVSVALDLTDVEETKIVSWLRDQPTAAPI